MLQAIWSNRFKTFKIYRIGYCNYSVAVESYSILKGFLIKFQSQLAQVQEKLLCLTLHSVKTSQKTNFRLFTESRVLWLVFSQIASSKLFNYSSTKHLSTWPLHQFVRCTILKQRGKKEFLYLLDFFFPFTSRRSLAKFKLFSSQRRINQEVWTVKPGVKLFKTNLSFCKLTNKQDLLKTRARKEWLSLR